MLYPLLLSLLVTLASGYPRAKGEALFKLRADPDPNPTSFLESQPVPNSPASDKARLRTATLEGNLATLQPTRQLPGTAKVPASDSATQPQVTTFLVDSNTLKATPVDGTLVPFTNNVIRQPSTNPARNAPVMGAVEMAQRLIGNPPGGALLVGSNPPLFPIEKRLISNYTKLRPVVTDTFRCNQDVVPNYVGYGYYADVDNDCQIFHICLPWKELYPKQFDQDVTYQFSFICPNQTVFSQDVMTCTWESEALPCEASPELYWLNQNFFRRVPGEFGMKYAAVNEKIVPPLVYDYDEFNPPKPAQG